MATLGSSAIDRTSGVGGLSTGRSVITHYTFPDTGTITHVDVYASSDTSGTIALMVYRPNGSNWDYIGGSSDITITTAGVYGADCSINIISGDYIGFYVSADCALDVTPSGSNVWYYKDGVKETGTNQSFGSSFTNVTDGSILVTYTVCSMQNDIYVNSSTGSDSACGATSGTPVQTFARAYALLNSAGNIHVLNSGADFSGETVSFSKSFSIDLNGASGNFHMPKAS